MKIILHFSLILTIFLISCETHDESKKLENYLISFSLNIKDYKVICFVPVDGCGSCISPSIEYLKNTDKNVLLVLFSIYKKSIENTIDRYEIFKHEVVIDHRSFAPTLGFSTNNAPNYYFLKKGNIVKKVDLSKQMDKKAVIDEVDKFLKE